LDTFRAHLPAEDFEFIDLSPAPIGDEASPPSLDTTAAAPVGRTGTGPGTGLTNACRADVACDVVVFSGEFAGSFFGSHGRAPRPARQGGSFLPGAVPGAVSSPERGFFAWLQHPRDQGPGPPHAAGVSTRAARSRLRRAFGGACGRPALRSARTELPRIGATR